MSFRFRMRWLIALAVASILAACEQGPATAPIDVEPSGSLELALEQMAGEAERDGRTDRAEAYRGGIRALRFGVRPSEIEVKIKNETYRYLAIVVGVERSRGDGERVLVRSLLAWTGHRPSAILQVSSASDFGLFGHPGSGSAVAESPGAARGIWSDLVNRQRWVATSGSADLELAGTGAVCPAPTAADPAVKCVLASWDVRINGSFEPYPDGGEHLQIHTNEDGVNGVVLSSRD